MKFDVITDAKFAANGECIISGDQKCTALSFSILKLAKNPKLFDLAQKPAINYTHC